jgi:hypothetical protein
VPYRAYRPAASLDAGGGTREMKVLALESLGAALVLFGLSGLLIKLA